MMVLCEIDIRNASTASSECGDAPVEMENASTMNGMLTYMEEGVFQVPNIEKNEAQLWKN